MEALGKRKLYSGITPPLIGVMLEKSIVFGFYEKTKSYGCNNFISGLVGGFISTVVVTPVDRLKINFQNNELKINSIDQIKKNFKLFCCCIIRFFFNTTMNFMIYFYAFNYVDPKFHNQLATSLPVDNL